MTDPISGRELAAFAAAVEAGSVHGAADALHLTQSAVTKRIAALERRLAVRLLDRGRHGVRPSPAGRALYPHAKHALDALTAAEMAVAGAGTAVRLAASHTIGEFLLPAWLGRYRAEAGGTDGAEVEIINSDGVLHAVREGRVDIGFIEAPADLTGLSAVVLEHDEVVAVVAAGHRWAKRRSVRPSDLLTEPYLARETGSGTRQVATHALRTAGVELRPSMQVASTESLKRAVAEGGFTLISRLTIGAEETAGRLRALPVAGLDLRRELRAVRRRRPALPPPARPLWRWLERLAGTA